MADLHQRLMAEVNGYLEAQELGDQLGSLPHVLRAVVELHSPEITEWDARCTGCLDAYGEYSHWPCATVEAIARELGIEVSTP